VTLYQIYCGKKGGAILRTVDGLGRVEESKFEVATENSSAVSWASNSGCFAANWSVPGSFFHAGEVIVETQVQTTERHVASRSIDNYLDSYLDAVADATAIFREAVAVYLKAGPEGTCWRQARGISEHMRTVDDVQQRLETAVSPQSVLGQLVQEMIDPLVGVSRLLKEMRRQVTGFAIESGFSGPGRRVPAYLMPAVQELTDEVCAAVEALVESHRPPVVLWGEQASGQEEGRVSWHEGQADRLSMELLKKIFADETLELKQKLSLAQLVEEIDRLADQAEQIAEELRLGRVAGPSTVHAKDSH